MLKGKLLYKHHIHPSLLTLPMGTAKVHGMYGGTYIDLVISRNARKLALTTQLKKKNQFMAWEVGNHQFLPDMVGCITCLYPNCQNLQAKFQRQVIGPLRFWEQPKKFFFSILQGWGPHRRPEHVPLLCRPDYLSQKSPELFQISLDPM